MPFVPVPNTIEVELRYLWAGQECENTLYFESPSPWTFITMESFASAIIGWWSGFIAPFISDQVTLREVYITDLTTQTSPATGFNSGLPIAGGQNSPSLPNNVALTVCFRTSNRGRSARGRNYVPGMVEAHVTNNTVDSTIIDGLETAYFELIGVASGEGVTWVVVSRQFNNVPRVTGARFLVREAVVIDPTVDSQRRRLPGRGR